MPSLAESRQQVRERLENDKDVDHDALLASLQDEIDRHNAVKDGLRDSMRKTRRSHGSASTDRPKKFRFKSGTEDAREPKKHRGHPRRDEEGEPHPRRKRRREEYPTPPQEGPQGDEETPHPFPREPADPLESDGDAFRASLFDALADDEGAAAYWENVYSQPIHVYSCPTVQNTATGELEEMNDEEYAEYVKQQMWERKHPEVVFERRKREREKKLEEEERTRRREEFVRRKEQAAWERSQRRRFRGDGADARDANFEYEFAGEKDWSRANPVRTQEMHEEYLTSWAAYLGAWDRLKLDLLQQRDDDETKPSINPSKRIPWPVLKPKPPTKPNIEAFMQHAPGDDHKERLRTLKAERVRWHPDKIQQRFGGAVDDGTMKLVTGVFQVVDSMVEEERKRVDGL
jgi:hypothetical protein